MTNEFERLLSASEAAKLLGIHPVTLLKWARRKTIPSFRIGRKVAFRVSELEAWLKKRSE